MHSTTAAKNTEVVRVRLSAEKQGILKIMEQPLGSLTASKNIKIVLVERIRLPSLHPATVDNQCYFCFASIYCCHFRGV